MEMVPAMAVSMNARRPSGHQLMEASGGRWLLGSIEEVCSATHNKLKVQALCHVRYNDDPPDVLHRRHARALKLPVGSATGHPEHSPLEGCSPMLRTPRCSDVVP